ncbi:MAG: SDR family NAD(P)-dependent oxidoreductase [Calditrichaeota bacterium]|nr:MAG: SDR family NAD(P)-dependent oxidoreductase [Calditrichota bacterium]
MQNGNRSILITGANGFVGARLCRKFLSKNYHVIAGVRKNADLSQLQGLDIEFRYGDVTDKSSLETMVIGVDYIIHNAGIVKAKNDATFYDVNETGSRNLCEAVVAHNQNLKKLIYISSLAAAGPALNGNPVTEDDDPRPITTYGCSKLAGEKTVLEFKDKLHVLSVRPPGIYGPGDKEIFSFFETVHKRIKPYIGDIQRKLQLVHVDDLCEGIVKAIEAETASGSIYFIAEKDSYTMEQLIAFIESAVGKKGFPLILPGVVFKAVAFVSKTLFKLVNATPMLTPEKAGELLASWEISTAKAKDELGFESSIPFADGSRETYNWYIEKGWLR